MGRKVRKMRAQSTLHYCPYQIAQFYQSLIYLPISVSCLVAISLLLHKSPLILLMHIQHLQTFPVCMPLWLEDHGLTEPPVIIWYVAEKCICASMLSFTLALTVLIAQEDFSVFILDLQTGQCYTTRSTQCHTYSLLGPASGTFVPQELTAGHLNTEIKLCQISFSDTLSFHTYLINQSKYSKRGYTVISWVSMINEGRIAKVNKR